MGPGRAGEVIDRRVAVQQRPVAGKDERQAAPAEGAHRRRSDMMRASVAGSMDCQIRLSAQRIDHQTADPCDSALPRFQKLCADQDTRSAHAELPFGKEHFEIIGQPV